MRKAVKFFVKYGIMPNIVIAMTIIVGFFSLWQTKKTFFPERESRFLSISVAYLGASPEEMEEGVTQLIEEAIRNLEGVEEINSTSSENRASISVKVLENYDREEVYTELKNAIDQISSFPAGAERPVIYKQRNTQTVMWLGLVGDENTNLYDLKRYAEDIEDELLASGEVSQVSVMGFPNLEISIEVSEETLNKYGLTFDQVTAAVRGNNRDVSGGSIKTSSEEILIRSRGKKTEAEKIANIIVRTNADGSKLLLKDVATVEEKFADVPSYSTLNGQEAVYIRVDKLITEDLEEIADFGKEYVKKFNEEHPHLTLEVNFSFMDMLQQRLDMLVSNGIIGLLLVLVVLGLFLSLRLSAWVAWGIPSSFLGLFILGMFIGFTINMISLFGMILVVGILVDDGIVIAENIFSHFEKGKSPMDAAIDGTLEVLPAVTTSVTTTMVAFAPLLYLESFSFLRDLAVVVIFSLGFSLIEAFFVLPAHLASEHVLRVKSKNSKIRSAINRFIDFMRYKIYGNMLKVTLRNKYITAAVVLALFPLTFGLLGGGFIKATFFPQIPFFSVSVDIAFKPGTREQVVEEYVKKFEDYVWEVNEEMKAASGDTLNPIKTSFAGIGYSRLGNGSHVGQVQLFYREDGNVSDVEIIKRLREKIGEIPEAEKLSIGNSNQFGKPVSVKIMSKDPEALEGATAFLKNELQQMEELKEVNDDNNIGNRELQMELTPQAYFVGFSQGEIAKQIRQGFFGEEVQRFQKGKDEIRVWVRYPKSDRISLGQLENIKLKQGESEYYFKDLVDYSIERGIADIQHYQTNRTVTVDAELTDPYAELPPILARINNDIVPRMLEQFPTVKTESGGQAKESNKAMVELVTFFGGAFLIIIILIMITFRSFYQAMLVITMIPIGWIGSAWGHGIESFRALLFNAEHPGFPISLLSAWGMIALSGVIINDAVVFLDKYNRNLKEGMNVNEAAYDAGVSRFRPIILTSLTTVLGLYPLILEKSFQAQFLIPMAISVAYGVLIGTFIILLFFPVLIVIYNDIRVWAKWLWTGKKPTREEVERVIIDMKKNHPERAAALQKGQAKLPEPELVH